MTELRSAQIVDITIDNGIEIELELELGKLTSTSIASLTRYASEEYRYMNICMRAERDPISSCLLVT